MPAATRIVGSPVSPYVRKALVFLERKRVPYDLVPQIPFLGDEEFTRISPLRRIPVLIDDRVTIPDSSVICQYLEDRYPEPALYPRDAAPRARARWYEEYADTKLGDVFVWRLFYQKVIRPAVQKLPTDAALVAENLAKDVPQAMDYLESQVPESGFLCGDFSIADVSVAAFFRNAFFAGWRIDAARWPRTAAYVARVHGTEPFPKLAAVEEKLLRVRPEDQLAFDTGLGRFQPA